MKWVLFMGVVFGALQMVGQTLQCRPEFVGHDGRDKVEQMLRQDGRAPWWQIALMVKKFDRVGKVLYFRFRMFMMSNGFGPDSILARDNLQEGLDNSACVSSCG